jgi:hypothetical protein
MMRARDNHIPEIEELAERMLADVGHRGGALSHRSVSRMAEGLGFELIYVDDLPRSTRSVTDLGEGRIYLPPASIPGGHGLRSMALQAMAHRVLGHEEPASYADFLRQRLEINYFAAACLMPLTQSVEFLAEAKARRDLAVEDFRDAFGVTHEAAALRLTNISTTHLDLRVHFLRVGGDGAVYKAYENDGRRRGAAGVPGVGGARRVRPDEPHDRVPPVHGHARGDVLVLDADGIHGRGRVLDLLRRAVRAREVVPGAGDDRAERVALPGRVVLPAGGSRGRRPVARPRVAERPTARAHPRAAAARVVPRGGRPRAVRVPRPARGGVTRRIPRVSARRRPDPGGGPRRAGPA